MNQASPVPLTRMPKSVPLRHMAVTMDEPGDVARRVGHGLAHRHGDVEEELVVAGDEGQRVGERASPSSDVRASQGAISRRNRPVQATLRWCISSPMPRPAGDQRLQGHAAARAQRLAERRAQHVAQPGQALQHLGVVAAEAHDLAEALVDGAVGAVAECAVLHHHHRHRRAW